MLDMTASIAPNSDQLNADDLISGPIIVTIEDVTRRDDDPEKFNFHLAGFPGRPYRPSKGMGRVMVAAWTKNASTYVGKRLELYNDPTVKFGRETVGGIRISRMSHIDKPLTVSLTLTRGKREKFTVQPLPEPVLAVTVADVEACTDVDQLRAWWQTATDDVKQAITARANHLADLAAEAETAEGELVQDALIEDEE